MHINDGECLEAVPILVTVIPWVQPLCVIRNHKAKSGPSYKAALSFPIPFPLLYFQFSQGLDNIFFPKQTLLVLYICFLFID